MTAPQQHTQVPLQSPPPAPSAGSEPQAALPAAPALFALTLAAGALAAGGWLTLGAVGRGGAAIWAPLVAGGQWLVFAGSLLALRPWRSRPLSRWPALWLASRAGCFLGTLVLAVALLYSAPQADRLAVGLLLLIGYALLFTAESIALARGVAGWGAQRAKPSTGSPPQPSGATTDRDGRHDVASRR
ncbi:MAG: hypothetical protein D6824_09335 [Planctomycetota bacterium]|nr:MAG: hypothetical protein D6824_09335 [Planctomycetota bacterium]